MNGSSGAPRRGRTCRVRQPAFCSAACVDACSTASCANWSAPELDASTIQTCIDSTPCVTDPALACGGAESHTYDWDCYIGCVMTQSQAIQDRVLANLRCDFPPAACH